LTWDDTMLRPRRRVREKGDETAGVKPRFDRSKILVLAGFRTCPKGQGSGPVGAPISSG